MRDWFYSTLAAGVLFIASVELMLFGFCYIFFFLGLEDPANRRKKMKDELKNGKKNDINRHGAGGTAANNSYQRGAATIIREGGIRSSQEQTPTDGSGGRRRAASAAAAAASAAQGGGFRGEEGLRRRTGVGGSSIADSAARGPGVHPPPPGHREERAESSPTSWLTASLPVQSSSYASAATTLPPGVQAYQRGARYVVQARDTDAGSGRGDGAGGEYGSEVVGSRGGEKGGGSRGEPNPRLVPENASQEELDAAALASWAALDATDGGSVPNSTRGAASPAVGGGRMGVDEGRSIVGQGSSRVVEEGGKAGCVDGLQVGSGHGGGRATGGGYSSSGSTPAVVTTDVGHEGEDGGNVFAGTETGRAADVSGSSVDVGDDDRW